VPEPSPQQQWLDALEGDRAQAARAASVPADVDKERFEWSLEVLHAFLGTDWLRRELAARAPGHGYLMFGGNQDDEEYPSDQQLRLFRAHSLATDLLGAQNFRGFEQWLEHLPRRSLREAAAELRAVRHMATAGSDVELLTPDPQAGRSPDARFLLDNAEAWVEVKAKEDRPARAFTTNSVTNSLKTAVRQLPDYAPGLVYLQLPYAWGGSSWGAPGSGHGRKIVATSHRTSERGRHVAGTTIADRRWWDALQHSSLHDCPPESAISPAQHPGVARRSRRRSHHPRHGRQIT
jgi:hypothetical protein